MTSPAITPSAALMMAALATVWGGSFFLAEIALNHVPPLTITLHRVAWALPVLFLVIRLRGIAIPRSPRIWSAYLVMGALNNAIPFSLIFWGQTRIDSGLAAILNGTTAVFAAVVAGLVLADEPLTPRKIIGALFGLAGVAAVMGPGALSGLDPTNLAQLAILGAALSYALASVWGRAMLSGTPPEMNALGMLTGSTLLMLPLVLLTDGMPTLALPLGAWAALLALSTLSTALAYLLYFGILARAGAANLMLVTLMIPPVAVALGAGVLGERLSPGAIAGFALIALGLIVTDGRAMSRLGQRRAG
ncbi:DMT family transporter [Roseovarius sp.]|uniref:DMT family transporter n=1 Tax=Roseovarius sp. TaxID=1486281 RepID=UPI00260264CE|nr:DMT family transporter [Roseovarius sp.]MDM8166470.1 DMT family transporter [Roseovarius sp.]